MALELEFKYLKYLTTTITVPDSIRFLIIIPNPSVQPKSENNGDLFSNIPKIEYIKTSKSTEVGGGGWFEFTNENTHCYTLSSEFCRCFSKAANSAVNPNPEPGT